MKLVFPRRAPLALALVCAVSALTACSPSSAPPAADTAATAPAAVSGIDLAGIDTAIAPGDDFDAYANGVWAKNTEIPADRSSTGVFLSVFEKAEKRLAALVEEAGASKPAAGTDAQRIADYYAAYLDEAAIEARGLAGLQPQLDAIGAIDSTAALSRALGASVRADVDPINATDFHTFNLFGVFVAQGLQDTSRNVAYLLQGGLGMSDREYYLSQDAQMAALRTAYREHVQAVLAQAGEPEAAAKAEAIVALETRIAQAHASVVDTQDIHKANNQVWSHMEGWLLEQTRPNRISAGA